MSKFHPGRVSWNGRVLSSGVAPEYLTLSGTAFSDRKKLRSCVSGLVLEIGDTTIRLTEGSTFIY